MESRKEVVRGFVHGRFTPSVRDFSIEDFKQIALAMRDETIVLTAQSMAKVLQAFVDGKASLEDIADWVTLVFYGVHPSMIQRRRWGVTNHASLFSKKVEDPTGIKKIHVRYEEKCEDVMSEIMNELEDLGDVRTELGREDVQAWIRMLSACTEYSRREPALGSTQKGP